MENPKIWKPVSFISYSPKKAEEYFPSALQWSDLPPPSWTWEHFKYWDHISRAREIKVGKYYGSAIVARRGERIEHQGGGYHYQWKYIGMSFSEIDPSVSMVITTFAVLDFVTKRMYAIIAFSG